MEHQVIQHFLTRKNAYMGNRLQFRLPNKCESLTLLELGCGAVPVINHDSIYIGIDIVPLFLKYMKRTNDKTHLILADAKNIPIRNKVIHGVALNSLLHHLIGETKTKSDKKIDNVFKEISRAIKPKSIIYIRELVVSNKLYSWILYSLTLLFRKLHISLPSLGIYDGTITNFLTEKKLIQLAESNGFIIIRRTFEDWIFKRINLGKKGWYTLKMTNIST